MSKIALDSDLSVPEVNRQQTDVSDRLREAMERMGGYNALLQTKVVSSNSLNRYLKGFEMKVSTAAELASACGVSPQWLLFGDDRASASPAAGNDNTALIDYYDIAASAGFGASCEDAPIPQKVSISRDFLHSDLGLAPAHTIMLQVSGDSMEPTMRTGDKVIVDTSRRQLLDGIHVLVMNGALLIKRLATSSTGIRIISDNERYPSEEAEITRFRWGQPDGDDAITIIGRVAYRLQAMS